jgi:hypothetical protein
MGKVATDIAARDTQVEDTGVREVSVQSRSALTSFHVHPVDFAEALEKALDLGLPGIVLEVAAENLSKRQDCQDGASAPVVIRVFTQAASLWRPTSERTRQGIPSKAF